MLPRFLRQKSNLLRDPWQLLVRCGDVFLAVNRSDEIGDCLVLFDWMSQVQSFVDSIRVTSTCPNPLDITSRCKVGNDSLHSPFCNPNLQRHVANSHRRITGQTQQHVCVIGQERPPPEFRNIHAHRQFLVRCTEDDVHNTHHLKDNTRNEVL